MTHTHKINIIKVEAAQVRGSESSGGELMDINGKKFVVALANSDLTSQQLQEKAGVSVRVIWKAKQGARLSPRSAGRLARALGVTVAEIAN